MFDIRLGRVQLGVPECTAHSFNAFHNKIRWVLRIHGEIERWPDVDEEYEILVLPRPLGGCGACWPRSTFRGGCPRYMHARPRPPCWMVCSTTSCPRTPKHTGPKRSACFSRTRGIFGKSSSGCTINARDGSEPFRKRRDLSLVPVPRPQPRFRLDDRLRERARARKGFRRSVSILTGFAL